MAEVDNKTSEVEKSNQGSEQKQQALPRPWAQLPLPWAQTNAQNYYQQPYQQQNFQPFGFFMPWIMMF